MKINALMIDETDNVVTCVEEVSAGSEVFYRKGDEILSVKALEDIPYCHKVALKDFEAGDDVIKYGESLGKTNVAVKKGGWLWDKNMHSVPRDYDSEMIDLTGGK
ncbi:MAG: UxaA family hydrolase [Synergistaceae bacterium]|nr:UxaA family hydrolase [Synergistaceae bacterium]MBQ3347616.1 UxaA family hydrolase [Synergistaceae bacterium]MBQ4400840.1 UxaA family hydrolase [Synergistaceae bacterium]MBQ6418291.1 UxaA family hydrolase [Synergistaceae bacterium]MBQ6665067.1 UxaA family hydrolase [Synergistaceae bacterium]